MWLYMLYTIHAIHPKSVRLHLEKKSPALWHSAVSFSDSSRVVRYDFKPFHCGSYKKDLLNAEFENTHDSKVIHWGQTEKSWDEIFEYEDDYLCNKNDEY